MKNILENIIKNISFDNYYNEATFQFKLLMGLGKIINENNIFPERNIEYYELNSKNFTKKEVDIIIENKENIAIELKMPMNGQVPEQMFKFIEDIKFLEELKDCKCFQKCYFIVVTNDSKFWKGQGEKGIYTYFRKKLSIYGKIYKPTGKEKNKINYTLKGKYKINWSKLNNEFQYLIIEI